MEKEENFKIIAQALTRCMDQFSECGFSLGDVLRAYEVMVAAAVFANCNQLEAKNNLIRFLVNCNELTDMLYLEKSTNQ